MTDFRNTGHREAMTVLTFMPRFHDKVRDGRKPHTIRPRRKRPIKSGDRLSLRGWSGRRCGCFGERDSDDRKRHHP